MVRLPSLRRSEPEPVQDNPSDVGTVDRTAVAEREREPAPRRNRFMTRPTPLERAATNIERAAERAAAATHLAAARAAADRAHARPRTSAMATTGLVLAVVAVLAVATGALAAVGVAVGVVATLLAIGATAATGRRHFLAGRTEAAIGVVLGLVAVVVGALALTGSLSWLDPDTNQVERLRDWLDSWFS